MRTIHQGPRAPSPDSQAEYTQAIRPRYLPFFENALAFGGSPYTGLGCALMALEPLNLAIVSTRKQEGGRDCTDEREQHIGLSVPGVSLRTQELIRSLS